MEGQMSDYREKTAHGDALLPVSYYHCHIPENFHNVSLHWHEETEIAYIAEGSANYTVNFERISVQEGDLILISPHVLHGVDERQGYRMVSLSLVFHLNFLGCLTPDSCSVKYLNPLMTGKCHFLPVIRPDDSGYTQVKLLFLEACRAFCEKEDTYELRTRAFLTELLSELYLHGYVATTERGNYNRLHAEEKLKRILTYIQDHYSENLSIRELAEVCHFSETHVMNFFRKYTGATCVEYINRYRLSRAAAVLEETDLPVMEIALENGFRNVSYFNRMFRKQFGCTPVEYRKRQRSPARS